jgi:hypothetical protein
MQTQMRYLAEVFEVSRYPHRFRAWLQGILGCRTAKAARRSGGERVLATGRSGLFLYWCSIGALLFLYCWAFLPAQPGHDLAGTSAWAWNIPTSFSQPLTCCQTRMKIQELSKGM